MCQAHAPRAGSRCPDCEAEYTQVEALIRSVPVAPMAVRVGAVVCVCLLLVLVGQLDAFCEIGPYLSFAGAAMTGIFLCSLGVLLRRRRSLRQRFLAEQSEPAPPPALTIEQPIFLTPVRW